ncbi:site-specific DNA-methyltransferase [Chryseobacterium aquaticum]|uniref:site-specific DNA-methyltransferase (adenine-specific) n=1 Tax=Chryseobacterium aquaticum TaxID=452084 RepID=A0A848N6Y4_9FLAO|nr:MULTISPECIES: site-specific DNA-methyltransferase [Chryseobacterium]NMR33093.1 site-specific DNA-methyltransferase [Chryseobacterium aquaticum]NRQ44976.1 site-specific DNA-methyltransferase [Chryseobacterium sp. C-204]
MIQDTKDHNDEVTINSRQIAILKEHFPACFSADGAFDITRFQEEIKDKADIVHEGYELRFLGKSYAKLLASTDTTTVIVPNEAHNSLPENVQSENIYISGDNLDGLKHLLKSYQNSIKCIYIDPPYNTGSDGFVYQDNFNYTIDNLQEKLNVSEDEAQRIIDLTKRGSASHSAWLMFMYCRLLLARDVLSNEGVIFISIDDNEQANLKLLCDDVFGEENFLGCIARTTGQTTGQDSGGLGSSFDYLLVYSRNSNLELNGIELTEHDLKRFENEDERGKFAYDQMRKTGSNDRREDRPNMYYAINDPDGNELFPIGPGGYESCWRIEKKRYEKLVEEDFVLWKKTKREGAEIWWPYIKYYLEGRTKRPSPLWDDLDGNKKAARDVRSLFDGKKVFDFTKPVDLLKRIITISTDFNDVVLDFFSGSASTADAVMQINAKVLSNRKFIAVQLPEVLSKEDASQKAAYDFLEENQLPTTLDYIGIERIKRAAAKIKTEQADKAKAKEGDLFNEGALPILDLGFKHYTLAEPNQNTLDKLESFDKANFIVDTTILDDFGKPTVLATWLNADGYGLTANAEPIDFAGYTAYYYDKHLYLIDEGFTLESMKALLAKYDAEGSFNPENIVLFGYSFPAWSITEMIEKNLRILNDGEKNLKINYAVRY